MRTSVVGLAILAASALAGCASTATVEAPANFDPASCYTRAFNIYFEGENADLSPEAREVIAAVDHSLRGCHIEGVRVVGQTGAIGTQEDNMEVSARRAELVAAYLRRATDWPDSVFSLRAVGEEGAVTEEGLRPVRQRASIIVNAVAPPEAE